MKLFSKWIALGLVLLAAGGVGLGFYTYDPLPPHPDAARLSAQADKYRVEIIRDQWGVPHIYGQTNADTAFGLAYAHAEDDYQTIQEVVAATRGSLARYYGAEAAPTDYIVALLDVWGIVEARYETDVPEDIKAISEAYAAGLNLYASEHAEASWAGLAPFRSEDVIAGFILKTPFFYGFDETLKSLFSETRDSVLAADPDQQAWLLSPTLNTARGSNAFAVAPSRSDDGKTRLLINSHQPMTGPVAWWEAHTVSQEGLDMTGGLFPGSPVVLHGFNRALGWANTVSKPDLVDVYRLFINPDKPSEYRLDGAWRAFETSEVTLRVKLFGPFAWPVRRKLYRSVHGPVIEAAHGLYAVRYAGQGEIRQLEQYVRLNHALTYDEFDQAMALNALPSINYIYADREGNIAFIHNGQYPDRLPGWDWSADLPGDRSDLIWSDYIPYTDVPKLINPQSGFLYNANNTPYKATDGPDNLYADDFSETLGLQLNQTNRALRIEEVSYGLKTITRQNLLDMKFDTAYSRASEAAEFIHTVLQMDWSHDPLMAEAAVHLAGWDYHTDIENRHAALAVITVLRHITGRFTGDYGPDPEAAFRQAVDWLMDHYGRIDPAWGEVNRLVRGRFDAPVSGAPDVLRAIYPLGLNETGKLTANAGDTWMALIEWDEAGRISAELVHQYGSATLDEGSPHYSDQASLFVREGWRKALLERDEITDRAGRIYQLGYRKE